MNSDKLKKQSQQFLKYAHELRTPLFILLVIAVYGFVVWRISVLQNVVPNSSSVNAQTQASPHIDQATVKKVQQLQDNSVNLQALFNQARQNPFQE